MAIFAILIVDLGMPVSYSSFCLLLLRFSCDSLITSKKINKNKNGFVSSTSSRSNSASVAPLELHTADNDDDNSDEKTATAHQGETTKETQGETKSAENVSSRRGSLTTLAADDSIDSIAAVGNIVNMILAPMVIVPFFDYLKHGKIPRSNTAKPGTADGAFAKMGSLKSISQPRTQGWTVIFVSVRSFVSMYP